MTRSPTLMAVLITFGLLSLGGNKWPFPLVGVGMLGLAVWIGINRLRPKRPTVRPTVRGRPHTRTVPQDVKVAVAVRDDGKCRICGSKNDLQYDHIIPYSLGGRSDDVNNIQLLCGYHNRLKSNRHVVGGRAREIAEHGAAISPRIVDLDRGKEGPNARGMTKHQLKVGVTDGGMFTGETVRFTAERLGTVHPRDTTTRKHEMDWIFYQLPDGRYRVYMEALDGSTRLLEPSDAPEALSKGQPITYGSLSLEELMNHEFNFGVAYKALMEHRGDAVQDPG